MPDDPLYFDEVPDNPVLDTEEIVGPVDFQDVPAIAISSGGGVSSPSPDSPPTSEHREGQVQLQEGVSTPRSEEEEEIHEVDTDRVLITTQHGLISNEDSEGVKDFVMDQIVSQQSRENPIKVATPFMEKGQLAILPLQGPTLPDGREEWTAKESGDQLIAIIRSGYLCFCLFRKNICIDGKSRINDLTRRIMFYFVPPIPTAPLS